MRIISKWKDYYDHEVAYYGYDETRIYDRRALQTSRFVSFSGSTHLHEFIICGKKFPMVTKNGLYYTEPSDKLDGWSNINLERYKGVSSDINQKLQQPVLLAAYGVYTIPILSTYGFASIIDSRTMYGMIYDYLGWLKDNPPPPDNQTNKGKIISHGFDLKSSFRPKMKKAA